MMGESTQQRVAVLRKKPCTKSLFSVRCGLGGSTQLTLVTKKIEEKLVLAVFIGHYQFYLTKSLLRRKAYLLEQISWTLNQA